jgi:RNA polymerase sigma-70 factor (ECF subfamily)
MNAKEIDFKYIERLQQGDLHAFTILVDKYKNMVFTIALKIIGNKYDAEDVAQESFVKAYQQIHSFKKESKFSTWLYTITYRTALYHLRKNKIDTQPITNADNESFTSQSSSQIEQLKEKEQKQYVMQAINKLPKTEALLITLFYINENTIEEINEISGLSKVNIKVKLFRARKKLMHELNDMLKHELKTIF